ncbi:MAG: hypothetical protein M4D80_11325 [Myxococcota bacterium]|nr:hypothetical protein [Deltaproteobacteria bacterium]MDQ3335749.1 hypothetical protein [Myxococcota bacterium]
MRNLFFLVAATLLASTAHANPTTQVCLGNIDDFLTCPAGAQRSGTECRAREPQRGQGTGEHWSGSKRQGPAVFMRDATKVSFAATYKDHKKSGRVFRFDDQGRLESWTDVADDEYNGLSVTCLPDGRAWYLAYYQDGRVVGISRSWRAKDGSFSYAMDHDAQGRSNKVTVPAAMQKRPDHLCQPQRCDVNAAPDLSGVPKP